VSSPYTQRSTSSIVSTPLRDQPGIRRVWRWVIAGATAVPFVVTAAAAEAQQPTKIWRVGTLQTSTTSDAADHVAALQRGLAELGYVAGRNVIFVNRNAQSELSRLPELASELVQSGVDVIVASINPATLAAKRTTTAIPIIMTVGVDPVAAGLVLSLARPGSNVTGLTFDVDATQLAAKRLEILKDLIPSISRVAILWNPRYGPGTSRFKGTEEAGRRLGIESISAEVTEASDLERTFRDLQHARTDAVAVLSDPLVVTRRAAIIGLAARYRMPAIYALREFVQDGGLVSYATSLLDQWRRAARYVDRVLKGAKPGDLPVEQPTAFELWINMKTARALGLTVPPALLLRADKAIE
jgi:putative ABC transport system substrate-binding protein